MAPSFSRVSSGALLLALAYNARPVKADFWEDVDNCKLVLDDLPADLTTDFCQDWTYGYQPEEDYVTVTGYPVTVTEYPDAKTCDSEGYSTTTKYPESTPGPYPASTPKSSKGYQTSKPTKVPNESTKVPNESTKVPSESTKVPNESTKVPDLTTKAPNQSSATYVSGGYDVTVTSTSWTTYWTTSTIYEGYPTATPAPYRRELKERAAWCVDRPCRLVQYDDNTIVEACKKYLGWAPHTSTVSVPGYTVTITSYPTDCKKKGEGYKPESIATYPTEAPYSPQPYPTAKEYPVTTIYDPASPPAYSSGPGYSNDDTDYSDAKQPWQNDFDNNYSGPSGPLPWDDVDQTSELADAIDAGGYDNAAKELGLDKAPWNALPADFAQKRDEPSEDSYGSDGDYDVVWVDDNGYPIDEDLYQPEEDSYAPQASAPAVPDYAPNLYGPDVPESGSYDDTYPPESSAPAVPDYAPNLYGPDVPESGSYDNTYAPSESSYPPEASAPAVPDYAPNLYGPDVPESGSYDDTYDDSDSYPAPTYELPGGSEDEYEGDEFESDYSGAYGEPSEGSWGEDGVDY